MPENPDQHNDPSDVGRTNVLAHTTPTQEAHLHPVAGVPADTGLPFRFRRDVFDFYEPVIAQAIRNEDGVHINPAPLRSTTYSARIRDAIKAKKRFDWPASFTLQELLAADLVVRQLDFTVAIGPRHIGKAAYGASLGRTPMTTPPKSGVIVVDHVITDNEITAFLTLLSKRLIAGPVLLKAQVLTATSVEIYEATFDVAFEPQEGGGFLIV